MVGTTPDVNASKPERFTFDKDNTYVDNTDDADVPMTIHREPWYDGSGTQNFRDHRVKTSEYADFLKTLERKRSGK